MEAALPGNKADVSQLLIPQLSRTFALTIPKLPTELQQTVSAAYLLCRAADTIEDSQLPDAEWKIVQLNALLEVLGKRGTGEHLSEHLAEELSGLVSPEEVGLLEHLPVLLRFLNGLPSRQQDAVRTCLTKMASGMRDFVGRPTGLADMTELDTYCYVVAGVVGEMLTELFCDHAEDIDRNRGALESRAASFGQGLQMTNILKDIWDDRGQGRCYLPQSLFSARELDIADLDEAAASPRFRLAIHELALTALGHLDNAVVYTLAIPRRHAGIRQFCLLAIGMAYATLNEVLQVREFSPGYGPKISRTAVRTIMLGAPLLSHSDSMSRWTMATLSKRCRAHAEHETL